MTPRPDRPMGRINGIGLRTLVTREIWRFLKVAAQTVTGPAVTTLLFLLVFSVALGRRRAEVAGLPYLAFLAPGLLIMAMAQNAFANASSSILIGKVQGTIADLLAAPLGPGELLAGWALGAMARGLVVGAAVAIVLVPFAPLGLARPGFLVFHALAGTLMLALLGVLGGLWAQKMDHLAAVTNFIVTPLTFLSGTFYSITDLPEAFRAAALANPFFYMIDGFRFGMTGYADGPVWVGVAVLLAVDALLAVAVHRALARGWRLKA